MARNGTPPGDIRPSVEAAIRNLAVGSMMVLLG
jgi:hypothetical protein